MSEADLRDLSVDFLERRSFQLGLYLCLLAMFHAASGRENSRSLENDRLEVDQHGAAFVSPSSVSARSLR